MFKFNLVIAFLIPFCLFSQTWTLQKDKNGIQVYTKPVDGNVLDASKAVVVINTDINKIVTLLMNGNQYTEWTPNCTESKIISSGSNNMVYYSYIKTPWPASDRDMVVKVTKEPIDNGYKLTMQNQAKAIDKKEGVVRIPAYEGYYLLEETSHGVKVTLEYITDPGGNVPDFLLKNADVKEPFKIMTALKTYFE